MRGGMRVNEMAFEGSFKITMDLKQGREKGAGWNVGRGSRVLQKDKGGHSRDLLQQLSGTRNKMRTCAKDKMSNPRIKRSGALLTCLPQTNAG